MWGEIRSNIIAPENDRNQIATEQTENKNDVKEI